MLLVSLVTLITSRRHFKLFNNCRVSWDTLYVNTQSAWSLAYNLIEVAPGPDLARY